MIITNGPYCVYAHINKINGKIYIGQTSQKPERRWRNGNGYRGKCELFWRAIQKYGWENFDHEIIASNLTQDEANNFEKLLIEKLNTTNPKNGYNIKEGGNNATLTEEIKNKIRECHIGTRASKETKQKMSEARKGENNAFYGKNHTEETKKKISEANRGENHPMYGKHKSEETKRKISEANKKSTEKFKKPILQYTKDGIFVREWDCSHSISRELGLNRANITGCCKGRYGCKTAGGFIWKYKEDNTEITK